MKILFVILISFTFLSPAYAGGDKNRKANPVLDTNGCVYQVPAGIDVNQCDEVVQSPGQIVYFCELGTTIVVCSDDPAAK